MADTVVVPPPPAPHRAGRTARRPLVVVALVVVAVAVVAAGLIWRSRVDGRSAPGDLLPIPAQPTGPVAATNTAASTGPSSSSAIGWDVVRTAADDHQLVVYFAGGGCGTFRADVTETTDAVAIAVVAVAPEGVDSCLAIGGPGALGIQLVEPLGSRRLDGARPVGPTGTAAATAATTPSAADATAVLLVPGPELATLTWPAGSSRATFEDLHRAVDPTTFVWTQRFDDPADDDGYPTSVSLEQWRGATPIDAGAAFQACHFSDGATTEAADVAGTAATLVRCRDGALAVLWMVGPDRLMVRADGDASGMDRAGLLALAGSVRFGG